MDHFHGENDLHAPRPGRVHSSSMAQLLQLCGKSLLLSW